METMKLYWKPVFSDGTAVQVPDDLELPEYTLREHRTKESVLQAVTGEPLCVLTLLTSSARNQRGANFRQL